MANHLVSLRSAFMRTMYERGFINDCTDFAALDAAFEQNMVTAYIGFDATAQSLHVGSLIQIMMLYWLQKTGHRPIVLMGGGTSKVGDPSHRAQERTLLTTQAIDKNINSIKTIFSRYIDFDSAQSNRALMLNNAKWLDDLNYLDFLRDIGRYFSVNRMLSFDSVKTRLEREQSLSFLEFNYMILQAYDFLELNRRHTCVLQIGGSDQWGNIVNGIDLARKIDNTDVFGLTTPLLTTASGKKMGKTEAGAIWLNADMLSPYDFWQFWRNTEDADVERFLKLYTTVPIAQCRALTQDADINQAKITLANHATTFAHGAKAAEQAAETAYRVFVGGKTGEILPTFEYDQTDVDHGLSLLKIVMATGFAKSGKDARRLIAEGSVKVNNNVITDSTVLYGLADITPHLKISIGRKRHALIVVKNA